MPRKTRSVRTLPTHNLSFHHPLPEEIGCFNVNKRFGEEIGKESPPILDVNIGSSDDDLQSILSGIKDLGTGKSSSSSLSWGDDAENEASRRVRDELDRMDRILTGQEPIPDGYDVEEYKEWMDFFPNLCAVGASLGQPSEFRTGPVDSFEEIIAMDPDEGLFPVLETSPLDMDAVVKTVIDQIYDNVIKQIGQPNQHKLDKPENINIDNYLKISPLTVRPTDRPRIRRDHSSRSLISSQISLAKWLKEDPPEFTSLPFLAENFSVKTTLFYKSRVPRKGILKSGLVLPPIDQFRSVSATPRRPVKSLSALSVTKSRLETAKFTIKNRTSGQRVKKGDVEDVL